MKCLAPKEHHGDLGARHGDNTIDIAGACAAFSGAVCVDSPVIIKLFSKKVNK